MGTSKTLEMYQIVVGRQIELYTKTEYWAVAVYKGHFGDGNYGYFSDQKYELIWEDETRDGYDTDTVLNGKSLQDLLDTAHQIIKGEQK